MKKILLFVAALFAVMTVAAANPLKGKTIYLNPGHGSFGPNDRPCATIPYPNLPTTGMPDTCGFYEANTVMWQSEALGHKLEAAGVNVIWSRKTTGPWPYVYPYSDYSYEHYKNLPDYEKYNRSLSEISEEVEANNVDMFISIHSNAGSEGGTANYLLMLYRGTDAEDCVPGSKDMCKVCWPYAIDLMESGLDPKSHYSKTNMNVRGDLDFYGKAPNPSAGVKNGYLGVLKHSAPGFLAEGYFHTYQPARHRALNHDYCHQEGIRFYRGIVDYFKGEPEKIGYIMGTVKDLHERMNHPLFKYAAKSNDQWVPCNGAVVTLRKAGKEIAKYNVDTLYNGIFVFENLEPGNDYTLDATCEGYKPLFEEYKQPIEVKANATTYPMIFLESESYIPPKVIYEDYPNPKQPGYAQLPSKFEMKSLDSVSYAIEGLVKRTIQVGDSTIILSHSENGDPHIYLINNAAKTIKPISVEGIIPVDTTNLGSHLALSDIAYSCDGYLVGCNFITCQFADEQVKPGYKRGDLQFYKWENLDSVPSKWVSTKHSANYYYADMGYTMAVYGSMEDCKLLVTGATTGSSTSIRFCEFNVVDNSIVSTLFTMHTVSADSPFTQNKFGKKHMLQLSPRDPKRNFIFDGERAMPTEFQLANTANTDNEILGRLPESEIDTILNLTTYFKYAHKSVMATPYTNAEGLIAGIRLYDVTDSLTAAKLIKTTNTDLAVPVKAEFASVGAYVKGMDVTLYLLTDTVMHTFTSVGVEQPVVTGAYAYGLINSNHKVGADSAVVDSFRFFVNTDVVSADLVFFKAGEEIGRIAVSNVLKGENIVAVKNFDLPGEVGDELAWAVEIHGASIANLNKIYSEKELSFTRAFNAVDVNPESDYFGQVYVFDRVGRGSEKNGLYVYDQQMNLKNKTPLRGGETFVNPTRIAVDPEGKVYIPDWADAHAGVYVADPANLEKGKFNQFFQGERNGAGTFINNGKSVGASTTGCSFNGTGADTKMLVYNEDGDDQLPKNGVLLYNVGKDDGSIMDSWGEAPTKTYAPAGQFNGEGNVWATSHGFFVSQRRGSGSNNSDVPSLLFYDYEGNLQFSSADPAYVNVIDGSDAAGFAVSVDESMLVLNNGSQEFLVFDIVWQGNKPVMEFLYSYKHGLPQVRQMSFDYAGNLYADGEGKGFHVYSLPGDNITMTPAKKALTVKKTEVKPVDPEPQPDSVEEVLATGIMYYDGMIHNPNSLQMHIYTANGQLLSVSNSNVVDMTSAPKGVYIIQADDATIKFVK